MFIEWSSSKLKGRIGKKKLDKVNVTKFKVTSKMHESVKHKEKCFLANSRMLIEVVLVISQVVIPGKLTRPLCQILCKQMTR